MNGLALCAGIGGLELGIKLALGDFYRTICYVEREAYPAACLVQRMEDGLLDKAPIWDDLRTFDGAPWRGKVDIVTAGYPCQPFSCAGKQQGAADERHLWPKIARIVQDVRPALCFFENVPNHLNLGFREVCEDLWGMGYGVEAGIFSAEEVGAPHIRKRLFILANTQSGRSGACGKKRVHQRENDRACRDGESVAHAERYGLQGRKHEEPREGACSMRRRSADEGGDLAYTSWLGGGREFAVCGAWPPGPNGDWSRVPESAQPSIRRVADGISARVERLQCLGNAVIPAVAAKAFLALLGKST